MLVRVLFGCQCSRVVNTRLRERSRRRRPIKPTRIASIAANRRGRICAHVTQVISRTQSI